MIDTVNKHTVTKTGLEVFTLGAPGAEHQVFAFGKILLLRKEHCIVLAAAGPRAGKKVELPLEFPATIDGVTYVVDIPAAAPVETAEPAKAKRGRAAGGETKLSKCKAIYAANATLDKAAVIKLFVEQAGCTPAGANTYYLTCKKG